MSEFLWGVSTSGYQSEGGYNGDGQPRNNWAEAEREGRVHRTGRAAEFWERYEEDFARAREMGCAAFRLGIEWPRVQPSRAPGRLDEPPPFDEPALDAYAERIAACRKAGLEPVVTLQHFTHPEWLGADAWLDDATVGRFAVYVARTVEHVNRRLVEAHGLSPVRWWITINEPNVLVQNTYLAPSFPGRRRGPCCAIAALNRLLAAHIRAYNAVHDLYAARGWDEPMVTTNTFCSDLYWSDQLLMDVLSMRERGQTDIAAVFRAGVAGLNRAVRRAGLPFQSGVFVWLGRLLHRVVDWMAPRFYFTPEAFAFVLAELENSPRARVFDYVGLDYYDPFAGHMFRPPSFADLEFPTRSLRAWLMDGMTSKWWDWRLLPEGLHFFCERAARLYGRPVLIAENGMALRRRPDNSGLSHRRDKQTRSDFLRRHVAEVVRLRKGGCPLVGYLHWSLTDNYEWGSYTPRFGLFTLDYTRDAERRGEDHLGDRPSETYARLIAAAEKELG
jgi:beta-glucosidase/6-phospho-beta-glucosidase/beta-galactosidase